MVDEVQVVCQLVLLSNDTRPSVHTCTPRTNRGYRHVNVTVPNLTQVATVLAARDRIAAAFGTKLKIWTASKFCYAQVLARPKVPLPRRDFGPLPNTNTRMVP